MYDQALGDPLTEVESHPKEIKVSNEATANLTYVFCP